MKSDPMNVSNVLILLEYFEMVIIFILVITFKYKYKL